MSDSPSLSLQCSEVSGQQSRVAVWRARERKGRGDALSDIRGGGAVETGSVGQWVTGPGSTADSAELSLQFDTSTRHHARNSLQI